jgi:myo-inositol 2-dehydrogenase/D-chiro-inositol 1-dehydrogenase
VLGVGVIGLGRMGAIHCDNLARRVPGARLVAVADADAARARRVGEGLGVAWTPMADGVVERRGVDAIVVATPPPTHPELIHAAAVAGKPVLCEKPLGYDEAPARAAVDAAA